MQKDQYEKLYQESIENPDTFWAKQAGRLDWTKPWNYVQSTSFEGDVKIRWFEGGELNVSVNCIDRHAEKSPERIALIWEPDDPTKEPAKVSYRRLHEKVCRFANALKTIGVKKGDRVTIYLPMIPEAAFAMLACARIGAVHSVVFGGFSAEALADRIQDCESKFLITSDESVRAGKFVPLKENADRAMDRTGLIQKAIVIRNTGNSVSMMKDRDFWWHQLEGEVSSECAAEPMDAEDPLFILYTSGSTNKPKGVLHTTGGYLVYAATTHEVVFDLRPDDVYWCTADIGWITGHSYMIYGPLANGATTLLYEGVPHHPSPSRFWEVIDRHQVSLFYTAPTAIRALMKSGDAPVKKTSRKSLRILGSVGEPLNPEAWDWYHRVVGEGRCPIVDTWWQTETGGILLTPIPGVSELKPGSVHRPFFGIEPVVVDDQGNELTGPCQGNLCFKRSWPGQMRTVYRDHERFKATYFSTFENLYFSGDGCKRDADGDYWITGRVDDVINVSGHRLGTAEIESSLVHHPKVCEAAVVGCAHDVKGQGIYCFVTLMEGQEENDELKKELTQWVAKEIGPIAKPDYIQWAKALPKTRSGKIMRRILRKIAAFEEDQLGDTSTLADSGVVQTLIDNRVISATAST